ncbi:hypothetical protein Syun_007534 [Stephania yunnanensis]|uniref:snRNA-activating protein complex subunit 3 n=1 Tax=Stephania yunnanensis TaxID=152371 RepID=A0AAP0L057_9MAGN
MANPPEPQGRGFSSSSSNSFHPPLGGGRSPPNSIPRGSPIFVPQLVGPLTTTHQFESSALDQLQSLRAEVCFDSHQGAAADDLSVEELKVFTEEELVEKALKVAFEVDEGHKEGSSQVPKESSKSVREDARVTSKIEVVNVASCGEALINSASSESENGSLVDPGKDACSGKFNTKSLKKRKRGRTFDRETRAAELAGCCTARVEALAQIKLKQEEDKAAARLHSFNGSCKTNEGAIQSLENIERPTLLRSQAPVSKGKSSGRYGYVAATYPEVVLCIEIYSNLRCCNKTQEFLVLGTQTLTDLKDQIYCLMDQLMHKDGQHDPSGYFLVENVFCNDLRDPSAIDYSEPVLEWLRNSKEEALGKWEYIFSGELLQKEKELLGKVGTPRLPQFRAVEMHKIRFCDLWFRLGAVYLYCHQGDCKHAVVIRDMRLIHPDDVQNRAAYPILKFQLKTRPRKCSVCRIYLASKITLDDKWAMENPCYFCDNCYYLLHYNEDGSLLYRDFAVCDYHPQ